MIEKIILKKSAVLDKMPAAEQLDFGELALNYNAAHPFLSFKDSDGDIMPLNDYSQDIAYLYSHKLDAGVLDTINENTDAIKKKLNITDFNSFKADNTKTLNALDRNVSQNSSEIQEVNGVVQNHTDAIAQKADKTELKKYAKKSDMTQYIEAQTIYATELNADDLILADISLNDTLNTLNTNVADKIDKTDITQSTGTSETAVMSQKSVSDALSNVYTKAESDARYLRGEFEYCGLMEWDGTNEVKIYEMKFDSPKREIFIYGLCRYDKNNKGQFQIIITNGNKKIGVSYYNSSSNAEECFHIHNVCGNYVCDINSSNNHILPNALKRCYMRNLLTDQNHEDVGLITNLKIEITTDLVRIDGVQKWFVFGKQ